MKRPAPERFNNRVIYLFNLVVTFPFVVATSAYHGAGRLRQAWNTRHRSRASDKLRQSRVRRSLRGLAGDHVQGPSQQAR